MQGTKLSKVTNEADSVMACPKPNFFSRLLAYRAQLCHSLSMLSILRGHFKSKDGKWLHIDTEFGNHFFVNDAIAREFLSKFAGQPTYNVYMRGVQTAIEILKEGNER